MGRRFFASVASIVAAFALFAGLIASGSLAQESGTPVAIEDDVPRPAHIHAGTCEELGDVVYPLTNVASASNTPGTPVASPAADDVPDAPLIASITDVDASLEDLLASEHAINVHASEENIQTYIACGNITGDPTAGELTVELNELNDSGYMGFATLLDLGDGTTEVAVALQQMDVGTPEATPQS